MGFAPVDTSYWALVQAFDSAALLPLLTRRASPRDADEDLVADVVGAWLALMRGEASAREPDMAALFARASATRDPSRVVEVTVLRALMASSMGKLSDALALARRASLMARTEALPEAEFFANIVLSRMRRHSGKPHLAVRIVDSLSRLAPADTTGWLAWERLLAGGTRADLPPHLGSSPASRATRAGQRLLLAARAGERAAFELEAAELVGATAGWQDMQEEAHALIVLLDPDRPAPPFLSAFRRGDNETLRFGLFGAGVLSTDEEPEVSIFVVARPGEEGRRVLRDGLGLLGGRRVLSGDEGARRTHGRTDAGLAVMTLSGQAPIQEDDFWKSVYGFPYVPAKHRGVLDVLLHRMRKRIAVGGVITRSEGRLGLELHEPVAVADPRCAPPAAARILSALAREPLATADSIATRLGITVRAAQIALQQLVADGACAMRRTGRQIEYQLHDTTFSEPTGRDVLPQIRGER